MAAIHGGDAADSVRHGAVLVAFSEALIAGDASELEAARRAVSIAAGADVLVEAAGVASNFQRMVRIADGTGITLGDRLEQMSAETRAQLKLDKLRREG